MGIFAFIAPAGAGTGLLAGGVRLDVPGAVLITSGSMALVAGIVGAADHGWGAPQTLIPAAVAAVLIALFVRVESRSSHALVPPAILRVRSLMTSSLIRGTLVTGMYGMFFLGALYLEQTRGFDAVQIGLVEDRLRQRGPALGAARVRAYVVDVDVPADPSQPVRLQGRDREPQGRGAVPGRRLRVGRQGR